MLVMTIGLPGSGKSTLIEQLALPESYVVVSADRVRDGLFGVVFDPRVESQVWKVLHALVEGHLRLGRNVVLDTTNLTVKTRKPWLRYARRFNRPAVAVFLDVPFGEVLRRNRLRKGDRVVPEDVIEQKKTSLEPPTLKEGFNKIITVRGASADDVNKVQQNLAALEPAARHSLPRQVVAPEPGQPGPEDPVAN